VDGSLRAIHERTDFADGSKRFRWLHPDGLTSKNGEIRPHALPLYGSEALGDAPGEAIPIIVEGEKKRDALAGLGLVVVGTVTGASVTPSIEVLRVLARFKFVLLWADNDETGRRHMLRIGELLRSFGVEVRYIVWREAPPKGDAADFVARGGTREEVRALLDAATSTLPDGAPTVASPLAEWEPPVPLYAHLDLPAFPVGALPSWVREYVERLAESTQTPLDLGGSLALAVLAGSVAGRAQVEVKGGYWQHVCLYVVVLPPGEGKSPVFCALTRPLWERERRMAAEAAPAIARAEAAVRLARDREAHARRQAAKGKGTDEEVAAAAQAAAALRLPPTPRLLASDVTSEALVHILAEQGGRLIIASAEGTLIEVLAGRYSEGVPRLEAICQAHDGESIRVDRVGRPAEYVPHPTLTLALAVQPDLLRTIAARREMLGRGVVARMLFSIPRSLVGSRRWDARGMRPELAQAWAQSVEALLSTTFPPPPEGRPPMHTIPLSISARERLSALYAETENRMAPDGDLAHMADWGGKYVGRVARIACVLALADTPGTVPSVVEVAHVERAVQLGRYYVAHAQAAYGMMGCDPATERALYVLSWLRRERQATVTRRDIMRGCRGIRRSSDLDPALDLLVTHGYVREEGDATERRGPGRPRAQRYAAHPVLRDGTDSDSEEGGDAPAGCDVSRTSQGQNGQKGPHHEEGADALGAEADSVRSVLSVPGSGCPLPHGDADYPRGWTVGDPSSCVSCGKEATSRDPAGVTRHPWCVEAR